ncbi:hypothetical protein RI129_013017 [Pyrocoelia pectoralis]|uniref:Reverse transcriptase domain-containing protein n=1 Tax=Pyrocoelia pectoralis TaxID=417401 RepID=A0AAN7ZCS7_9COLE
MGSPLSPVIANLFMEWVETRALSTATYKPKLWLRYVDDTFIIWEHGKEKLGEFMQHLNLVHEKIKFTMELEENSELPFLHVLVKKKEDGSLGHTVYRKKAHTDRYLNAKSHHHPAQLHSVMKTLITRSQRLADEDNKHQEMERIRTALLQNGFTRSSINKACRLPKAKHKEEKEVPIGNAYLPYIKGTTDKIRKIRAKRNIRTVFTTDIKISQMLPNPKTKVNLEQQGVYEIPCKDCQGSYIGQTNRRINVRKEEHQNAVKKDQKTSSLAQHVKSTAHTINFEKTRMIKNIEHTTARIIREAIEIEKLEHAR